MEITNIQGFACFVFVDYENPDDEYYSFIEVDGPAFAEYPIPELGTWVDTYYFNYRPNGVIEAFCWGKLIEPKRTGYFIRIDNGEISKEVFYTESEIGMYGEPKACISTSSGRLYAVVGELQGELGPNGQMQLFYEKVDPRQ